MMHSALTVIFVIFYIYRFAISHYFCCILYGLCCWMQSFWPFLFPITKLICVWKSISICWFAMCSYCLNNFHLFEIKYVLVNCICYITFFCIFDWSRLCILSYISSFILALIVLVHFLVWFTFVCIDRGLSCEFCILIFFFAVAPLLWIDSLGLWLLWPATTF